jgi:hypothetical protein
MIGTITLGLFSVLFGYLAKYRNVQWGLKASFFLIFLFLALRYNFGNDYPGYLNTFNLISKDNKIDYFDNYYRVEIGWVFLNRLFRGLGFFAMTAVLALFNCVIYYRFIKKYVPIKYYWLAIFLYVFTPGFMLIPSSGMRQSLAIVIFLFSFDYLHDKKAIRYFLCIGLASLFHSSAIILLPVYFLAIFNWKINIGVVIIFILLFVSMFLYSNFLSPLLTQFINSNFERYKVYQEEGHIATGLGVLYSFALVILTLYYERFQNRETALVFKISIISSIFMPLALIIALITRLGMYFLPATIVVYPIILMNLRNPIYKTIFLTFLLFFTIFLFFQFFNSETWKLSFGTYQTIFSAPKIF